MILLALASKQTWPHLLAVAHLKPERLILLHSDHATESRGPARRMLKFFGPERSGLVPDIRCEEIPHDDFDAIEKKLDSLAADHRLNLGQCAINFTGGNKLMATAAFRWAARRGVTAFYLERGNVLSWFEPRDGDVVTRTEKLDGHVTNDLDPVDVLRCQIDSSEVERTGENVTLNETGQKTELAEFERLQQNGADLKRFLDVTDFTGEGPTTGDPLEYNAAAIVLKLGVGSVRRSLRLKVKTGTGVSSKRPHAEIDLLFNWNGRLWLVDCKDRKAPENLLDRLPTQLLKSTDPNICSVLGRIRDELKIGQTKVLKEDLIAAREMGGLLGQIVCVRKSELPDEALEYALGNRMEVVLKRDLVSRWRALLNPEAKPDKADLTGLVAKFGS